MVKPSLDNEKRHFCRVPFIASTLVTLAGQSWKCPLLDISLKGLLIEYPDEFEMNLHALYSVTLTLSEEVTIKMQAKIIHSEAQHLGLEWVDIDLDSLSALRRLLEFNLNDPEEINRELAALLRTKK